MTADAVPLIVDLDGTLIDGDTLHLSLARLLARTRPWLVPVLPFVVLTGRARFKRYVSERVVLPARCPALSTRRVGIRPPRACVRATSPARDGGDRRIADAVAAHLELFDFVIASDGRHNAKGPGKLESIRAHLGAQPFDYMGDSMADVPVFRAARYSYLVCPGSALEAAVRDGCRVEAIFSPRA